MGDAPDPSQIQQQTISTANALGGKQTQANIGAQRGSMVNQSNPYGNLTWSQIGTGPNGVPIYGANVDPSAAAAPTWANMFAGQALAGGQANALLGNADYGNNDPTSTIGNMTSGLTGSLLSNELNYLNPFFSTERSQLDTQLRNQGLLPGQPAYDNAMRGMDTNHGLTVSQAIGQFEPQAFSQASSLYTMPLTMGQQLAQWGMPTDPTKSLVQAPQLQPADYIGAGAVGAKTASDAYNAQMQQYSGLLSGVSNLGGAGISAYGMMNAAPLISFSDERVKENKEEVGSLYDGTPVYTYNYLGDKEPRMGVMAQDVEKRRPDAVGEFGGIKTVDYNKATARSRAMKALLG